jgi:HSP90 family molecular chaperone
VLTKGLASNPVPDVDANPVPEVDAGAVQGMPSPTETLSGDATEFTFQAETRELLDIVANSLYTEKEVFIRELVSNASDALNKLRQLQATGVADTGLPLGICISVDEDVGTLTIADSGIGMSKEELMSNLGTIARSGSKAFLSELGEEESGADTKSSIIGRFGVGFYSVFMTSDKVTVYSRSAGTAEEGDLGKGWCWSSDGTGSYTLAEAEGCAVGTKVVAHLNAAGKAQFGQKQKVKALIQKYSNFVSFPIEVDGEKANTIGALWAQQASQVTGVLRYMPGDATAVMFLMDVHDMLGRCR